MNSVQLSRLEAAGIRHSLGGEDVFAPAFANVMFDLAQRFLVSITPSRTEYPPDKDQPRFHCAATNAGRLALGTYCLERQEELTTALKHRAHTQPEIRERDELALWTEAVIKACECARKENS